MNPIDPDRWNRVRELFDAAAELEGTARAEYLARACDGDPELQREVESLLGPATPGTDPLRRALGDALGDESPDVAAPTRIGSQIGQYRVLSSLGDGGMGSVYLAERIDDVLDIRVAIKVVRGGLDSARLIERFQIERRILSRLEHPNIARVLDGGSTDDGLPYLAMEHVDGLPIDVFSAERKLSLRERLRLFLDVCGAVDHAHQQLIVHRDIKPANILVESNGVPKLLDFGIAKLLDSDREVQGLTLPESRLMTPEYASPEQLRGEPVTTRTDVYGLGLLLFQLITDQHPFRDRATTPGDLAHVILETDPEKPSTAITRNSDPESGHTSGNPNEIRRLRRAVSGDLDNIVLQALAKDPDRRYRSVSELSHDVERYLDGRPVSAHQPSFSYRAGKFLRRNRVAVGVATAFAVTLLAATVISTREFLRADRLRAEAETQRETVEEINTFMREMFAAASSQQTQSKEDVTARDLLNAAAERIESELVDRPEIAAVLANEIGRRYFDLGHVDRAEDLHRRAIADFERTNRLASPDGVTAQVYLGQVLSARGETAAAIDLLRAAVLQAERLDDRHHDISVEARRSLAVELHARGDYTESEQILVALLDELAARPGNAAELQMGITNDLGLLYLQRGESELAERYVREAIELAEATLGDEHTRVGEYWACLAVIYTRAEQREQALACSREALRIHEAVFDEEHHQLAVTRLTLATALTELGLIDEAVPHYERVLEVFRATYGEQHPTIGTVANNMAMGLDNQGEHERALQGFEEAHVIFRQAFGEEHAYALRVLHNVARAHHAAGHAEDAERVCRELLELRQSSLEEDHPDIIRSRLLLAQIVRARGDTVEADALLLSAADACRRSMPPDDPLRLNVELELGRSLTEESEPSR